jgi:hypothetical protein
MLPRLIPFLDRDVGHFGCPGTVSDIETVPVLSTMICLRGSSGIKPVRKL